MNTDTAIMYDWDRSTAIYSIEKKGTALLVSSTLGLEEYRREKNWKRWTTNNKKNLIFKSKHR